IRSKIVPPTRDLLRCPVLPWQFFDSRGNRPFKHIDLPACHQTRTHKALPHFSRWPVIEPELDGSGDVAGVRGLEIAPDMTREPLNATKERANLGPHTLTVGDDLIGQVPLQVGVDQLVRV